MSAINNKADYHVDPKGKNLDTIILSAIGVAAALFVICKLYKKMNKKSSKQNKHKKKQLDLKQLT